MCRQVKGSEKSRGVAGVAARNSLTCTLLTASDLAAYLDKRHLRIHPTCPRTCLEFRPCCLMFHSTLGGKRIQ